MVLEAASFSGRISPGRIYPLGGAPRDKIKVAHMGLS
jgi:hypothetical protein